MPECQACHSKEVAWRQGKNGKPYLVDTRRPHFCPKRVKNDAGAAKNGSRGPSVPGKPAFKAALGLLIDMQYKRGEAKELLRDIPEGEPAAMVLAALKRKGA